MDGGSEGQGPGGDCYCDMSQYICDMSQIICDMSHYQEHFFGVQSLIRAVLHAHTVSQAMTWMSMQVICLVICQVMDCDLSEYAFRSSKRNEAEIHSVQAGRELSAW